MGIEGDCAKVLKFVATLQLRWGVTDNKKSTNFAIILPVFELFIALTSQLLYNYDV